MATNNSFDITTLLRQMMETHEDGMNTIMSSFFQKIVNELNLKYEYQFSIDATYGTFGWFISGHEVQPDNFSSYRNQYGEEYLFSSQLLEAQRLWSTVNSWGYKWQGIIK